jgi:hypothetical protein
MPFLPRLADGRLADGLLTDGLLTDGLRARVAEMTVPARLHLLAKDHDANADST